MKTRLLSNYTENILHIGEDQITTYVFGNGKKTVFLFPPFPHSGLLYMLFYAICPEYDVRYVTLDLPGWIGKSENSYKYGFSYERLMKIIRYFIDYYSTGKFSVLGFSFGTSIAIQIPRIYKNRVKNVVLVSPVVNGKLIHSYPKAILLDYLKKKKLYGISSIYVKSRFKKYKQELINSGFPKQFIDTYFSLFEMMDMKIVMNSLNNLFSANFSDDIKYLDKVDSMIVNSIDEPHIFIEQADYLRKILRSEKSSFLIGSHEDFLLFPDKYRLSNILNFVTK